MKALLIFIMAIIIATLWGMILYGMVTSDSLELTVVGLVFIVGLVTHLVWDRN